MKKLVGITGAILIICVLTGAFFAPASSVEISDAADITVSLQSEDVFIIKSYNNRIVVYKKGEDSLYMQTDTRIDNLPKGDIEQLKKGIEVTGKAALRKALEDYCS